MAVNWKNYLDPRRLLKNNGKFQVQISYLAWTTQKKFWEFLPWNVSKWQAFPSFRRRWVAWVIEWCLDSNRQRRLCCAWQCAWKMPSCRWFPSAFQINQEEFERWLCSPSSSPISRIQSTCEEKGNMIHRYRSIADESINHRPIIEVEDVTEIIEQSSDNRRPIVLSSKSNTTNDRLFASR